MPTGRILRCYVFTEGDNLQVLSVRFFQGGILHQTFSFSLVLREQKSQTHTKSQGARRIHMSNTRRLHTSNRSRPDGVRQDTKTMSGCVSFIVCPTHMKSYQFNRMTVDNKGSFIKTPQSYESYKVNKHVRVKGLTQRNTHRGLQLF